MLHLHRPVLPTYRRKPSSRQAAQSSVRRAVRLRYPQPRPVQHGRCQRGSAAPGCQIPRQVSRHLLRLVGRLVQADRGLVAAIWWVDRVHRVVGGGRDFRGGQPHRAQHAVRARLLPAAGGAQLLAKLSRDVSQQIEPAKTLSHDFRPW